MDWSNFFKETNNGLGIVIIIGLFVVARCFRLLMRHLNIRKHGWPPPHLNADGDDAKVDEVGKTFWSK
jgi:hypothetical protein